MAYNNEHYPKLGHLKAASLRALAKFGNIVGTVAAAIGEVADALTDHEGDVTAHITATERATWNAAAAPLHVDLTLSTAWTDAGSDKYTQTVTVLGGTANSIISLQPSDEQLDALRDEGVTCLRVDNDNGTFIAIATGAAPSASMTMQATATELREVTA